jgi:Aminotransferase class-III
MAWMASDNDQPVYVDHGAGSSFTDLDGFSYVDFNASDMAMFCGHANPDIVAAITMQAARSTMILLPSEACPARARPCRCPPPGPTYSGTSARMANSWRRCVSRLEKVTLPMSAYTLCNR